MYEPVSIHDKELLTEYICVETLCRARARVSAKRKSAIAAGLACTLRLSRVHAIRL